jgi:putative ABC transport system permease protein
MGIPLLRGRLFETTDTPSSQPVMLVSETAASTLFAGQDPIGRRVKVGGAPDAPWRTIVGIVGDVRHAKLTEAAWPQMYLPQSQFTDVFLVLVVKGSTDRVTDLVPAIRGTLRDLDPSVPLYDVARLQDLLSRSFAERRFLMWLLVGFAGVSLLLAAVGLYGVVSYTVARRTREVGVRVALGATRRDILRLVFGAVLGTAATGLGLGLGASAILTRFLRGQLVDVQPLDPGAVAGAVATLAGVIIIAHVLPVRRALAVDPSLALRDE